MKTSTKQVKATSLKLNKTFDETEEEFLKFVASVKEQGLLHNPSIRDNGEVIAGNRRVRAAQLLNLTIPVIVYPNDLPESEYKIISLHENIRRHEKTWYEVALMEKELHDIRIAQHGKAKPGSKTGWSIRDTAGELNISFGGLSEDLQLAEAFLRDPSLSRIKDRKTAKQVIIQQVRLQSQANLSKYNVGENQVLCGGSEEVLKAFPENIFDAVITDPPWIEFRDPKYTRDEFTLPVFKQCFRVMKQNSFLYAFVSTQDFFFYQIELEKIGFKVQKWPLIWMKEKGHSYGGTLWNYQRDFELILLAVKGSPALRNAALSAVFKYDIVPSASLIHPNEKPSALIRDLIKQCTFENALILDPFAGSGVLGEMCEEYKRKYVLIEADRLAYEKILKRLEKK